MKIYVCFGLAFYKKQGNYVELSGSYKMFSNSDKELNQRLKSIVSDIPEECIKIVEQVVFRLEKEYDKKVSDIIYVSLTDHIHGAVERFKKEYK